VKRGQCNVFSNNNDDAMLSSACVHWLCALEMTTGPSARPTMLCLHSGIVMNQAQEPAPWSTHAISTLTGAELIPCPRWQSVGMPHMCAAPSWVCLTVHMQHYPVRPHGFASLHGHNTIQCTLVSPPHGAHATPFGVPLWVCLVAHTRDTTWHALVGPPLWLQLCHSL
jgi:hypothetical protein